MTDLVLTPALILKRPELVFSETVKSDIFLAWFKIKTNKQTNKHIQKVQTVNGNSTNVDWD